MREIDSLFSHGQARGLAPAEYDRFIIRTTALRRPLGHVSNLIRFNQDVHSILE